MDDSKTDAASPAGWSWGRWLIVAGSLALVLGVVALVISRRDNQRYREMVESFYVGVAALEAGDKDRALRRLTEATALFPGEPAAWANLALAHMQLGNLEAAEQALRTAEQLAPANADIQMLWAALQNSRGEPGKAVVYLERAVELEPENGRIRYALAETLERQDEEQYADRISRLLDELAETYDDNLLLMLQRADWAARRQDREKLRELLAALRERADYWPPVAEEQLAATERAFAQEEWSAATAREMRFLQNVLRPTPDFKAGVAELVTPVKQVGLPLPNFLSLRPPSSRPAPADVGMSFQRQTLETPDTQVAALLAPGLAEELSPALVALGDRHVRRLRPPDQLAAIPGGDAADPPARAAARFVDWSRDFQLDLVLATEGGLRILEQTGEGTFQDVTEQTGLPAEVIGDRYFGVWTLDVESDGDMDLMLGPREGSVRVLRNNSDGTFAVADPFGEAPAPRAVAWADFDADGSPDVAWLDASGSLHVFLNRRSGRYVREPAPEGLPLLRALDVGDVDSDNRLDLVLLSGDGDLFAYSRTDRRTPWQDKLLIGESSGAEAAGPPMPRGEFVVGSDWLTIADLDNNGALDVAFSMGPHSEVWLQHAGGSFQRQVLLEDFHLTDCDDVTGDGRLDLLGVSSDNAAVLMSNQGTRDYHWQFLRPRALAKAENRDSRMNSLALGSEIQIRSGLLTQKRVAERPRVHFGLGEHTGTDVARIVWPHGAAQAEFGLTADEVVDAEQRLIGSCPFLFAHNGDSLQFVTDFLWRSPLGLRINAQETAGVVQTEDWVKVRGDQLAARDGVYDLRITADLWETHFFDYVSLLVVDHPSDVAVFVDERFCFPPPPLEVVATTLPRPLERVWDQDGRDVSRQGRERDRDYIDSFPLGLFQGIAPEHWVEIELGEDVPREGPLLLVAHGFVYPTDSSVNVSVAQGDHPRPHGLVLEVADGQGGWKVAAPDLGFPSGKDKTVLIDLEGVFVPEAPRRLRLRTNLEVYWDQLEWALRRPDVELRTRRLGARRADLRDRGISQMHQAGRKRPDLPTYENPRPAAGHWRDLVGYYTRFGDVRELLEEVDDRYVIMNAGDELRLEFDAAEPTPAGWTRDYVVIGDGWVKDGNLNTAYSRTVRPLPSHETADYDTPPGALEDDPVYQRHREDWRTFHTRYVDPDEFRRGLWRPDRTR